MSLLVPMVHSPTSTALKQTKQQCSATSTGNDARLSICRFGHRLGYWKVTTFTIKPYQVFGLVLIVQVPAPQEVVVALIGEDSDLHLSLSLF